MLKKIIISLYFTTSLVHTQNTVTDIDGNSYDYLTYGTQQWTVENAAMENYRDGTPIPQVTDATQWTNLTTGAWCYYENDPTKGKLYNWYAVAGIHDNDPNTPNKEFAPEGWHVPTDDEWTTLEEHLIANGYNYDGTTSGNKIAKAMASTSGWNSSTTVGSPGNNQSLNNSSAFNALPIGIRSIDGSYSRRTLVSNFWTSSNFDNNNSWCSVIDYNKISLDLHNDNLPHGGKGDGYSVRFVQDNNSCSEVSISSSATEVCAGESVDLTVSSGLTAGTTACTSTDLPANLQNGLVGYWPFCGNANDESGNGNNGTVNGATLTTDRFGNPDSAYSFDGNDWIQIPYDPIIDFSLSESYSISCIVNIFDNSFYGAVFERWGSNPTPYPYQLRIIDDINNSYIYSGRYIGGAETSATTQFVYGDLSLINDMESHNIIIIFTPETISLYVDGILVETSQNTMTSLGNTNNTLPMYIGRRWEVNNRFFFGNIDDVGIWNRVLSESEIQQLASSSTYTWSTGDTTANISVTPTETTEYWVDVTTNGVTCREYVTINVTSPAAPTGDATQTFCEAPTLADLLVSGDDIQWYDAATGGNLLDSTTVLTDGQMVYASQTIDGCESEDRLEVIVTINIFYQFGQDIDGGESDADFGSIALSSDGLIIAVGAQKKDGNGQDSGQVKVFKNISGIWQQIGNEINGENANDRFGFSVSLSSDGNILAVGAYYNDGNGFDSGHVRLYQNNNGLWQQIGQDIEGESIQGMSGNSISLSNDGSVIAIGARKNNGNGLHAGHVRVFQYTENVWQQIGQDIDSETSDDRFGFDVSLSSDGNIVAIGGRLNDGNGQDSGHVRVYENNGGIWQQIGQDIDGEDAGDQSGYSVSLSSDGNIVAIGAPLNDGNGQDSGHVRVYENNGGLWQQIGQDINGEDAGDQFGYNVSLSSDGNIVAIGAPLNDGNGQDSGHVRLFEYNGDVWQQIGFDLDGESSGDESGYNVSLSSDGNIVAIGAPLNDGNGQDSGHVRVYSTCSIQCSIPEAPTGDAQQTFCEASTVADLTATGDNIQWYDAATGGNLSDSTTALTNGQMLYASQTVNGCESTERLEVSVSIQEITITASATEVCAGESVDLTVSSGLTSGTTACTSADLPANLQTGLVGYWPFCGNANDESGNGHNGTVNGATLTTDRFGNPDSAYDFNENQYLVMNGSNIPTSTITLSVWVYQNNNFGQREYIALGGSSSCIWGVHADPNAVEMAYGIGCGGSGGSPLTTNDNYVGEWINFTYMSDGVGGNTQIYKNGIYIGQSNNSINTSSCSSSNLYLGVDIFSQPEYIDGKLDDLIIWNRALSPSEIQQLASSSIYTWSTGDTTETITVYPTETTEYWVDVTTNGVTCREFVTINVTSPVAPTGDTEQTFCDAATVADLTVTGDNIQWYDAATGGNLLDSTTALTDGQTVYASQTIDGCESNDRLEVTVSIQDITITASATEVCSGESVDLTASSGSTSFIEGNLIGELNHTITTNVEQNFATQIGVNYRLEITGNFSWGTYCPNLARDPAYTLTGFYGAQQPTTRDMVCYSNTGSPYSSIFCDTPGLRPIPDLYDDLDHSYDYYFVGNSNSINVGFQDGNALGDNCGTIRFRLYENSTPADFSSFTWSTGETTETITVTPTETTEYWVDVTTNGVTCREYITIDVTAPEAPTGDAQQTFCEASTVADLTATGENIQWYDAATGGNLLDVTTALTDGQMVYASQTIDGCESGDRFEVTVSIQEITITASATEICSGEEVTIGIEYEIPTICDMDITLTNIPFGDEIPGFTYAGFYNEHHYYIYNTPTSWTEGEQICRENGGYLVCINDEPENTFVSNLTNNNIWIGMFRDPDTCEFRWLDCIDITYTNWRPGEPNSGPCGEPYVQIIRGCSFGYNTWNNLSDNASNGACYSNMVPIMEIDPSIYEGNIITQSTFIWSTGDTTENITVTPNETTEYWVDVTTNGVTCREYITVNVNDLPNIPVSNGDITECETTATQNLVATATVNTGESITWYDDATGGNIVADPSLNSAGTVTYYAEAVNDTSGCVSLTRTAVTLTIESAPNAPESGGDITACETITAQNLVATATVNTGESITWYDDATGGNIVTDPSINAAGTVTYYAEAVDDTSGCVSLTRTAVTLTMESAPNAPDSGGDITACETIASQNLVATATVNSGESITWYDDATGVNIVADPSLSTAGTVTYYAEAVNDISGCVSLTRTAVTLTITSVEAPTGDVVQSFCDSVTVADLSVAGSNIQWYDAASGGNNLDLNSALSDGQVLYASQVLNGCESITRLEVSVEIDIIPDPILITTQLEFCLAKEATLADLEIDNQGFTLEWYDSFSGGNMLPIDTSLENGVSYYATLYDVSSGCESLMRLEVVPTVIPCEVKIYNALSLNDDGKNDYMVIENIEYYPINTLEVYNRNGQLVFETDNYGQYNNYFYGKANVNGVVSPSSKLPTGSYLYVFKYFDSFLTQERVVLKGFLTINSN